jgi:hypothetical protein
MTIIDLINKSKFKDVSRALRYYYPHPKISANTMQRYHEIFDEIGKYKINENNKWELIIKLNGEEKHWNKEKREWYWFTEIGEEYYSTDAINIKEKQKYAIEFTAWQSTANYKISSNTLKNYKPSEIVAHYLWKITFIGYHQEPIQNKLKELNNTVKRIKEGKEKLIPFEDVKNKLLDKK